MRFAKHPFLFLAAVVIGCSDADRATSPVDPPADPPAPSVDSKRAVRLSLRLQPGDAVYAGMRMWVMAEAFDAQGRATNTDQSSATSSDPSVAEIESYQNFSMVDIRKDTTRHNWPVMRLKRAGETTVRVTLGNITETVLIRVAPQPPQTSAVVVDSFTVVEYRATCVFDCPYLAYAPLLKLRETTGAAPATILGVEFVISTKTIGMCSGLFAVGPGTSAHVNRIDPYLWSNDLLIVNVDGVPLPEGPVQARVIVRDAKGNVGELLATGTIDRRRTAELPRPIDGRSWTC